MEDNARIIRQDLHFLCEKTTNLPVVLVKLQAAEFISQNQCDEINNCTSTYNGCEKLYGIVMQKMSCGDTFDLVCQVLQQSGNKHIVERLGGRQIKLFSGIYYNVKDPTESFTGRESYLEELHSLLNTTRDNGCTVTVLSQSFVIPGLGGIGKTETVRKYILEYSSQYNHIVWIDAEDHNTAETHFYKLAIHELGILANDSDNNKKQLDVIVKEVYERLCQDDKLLLIVFDNAESLDDTEYHKDGIRCFLPQSLSPSFKKPAILITSRNRDWQDQKLIELGLWTVEETIEFIKSKLKIAHTDSEAEALAEIFGRLPLSMQVVVAVINEEAQLKSLMSTSQYTVTQFINEYKSGKINILKQSSLKIPEIQSVEMLLNVTLGKIEKRKCGKLALKILNIIAYLPPTAILKELVFKIISKNENDFCHAMQLLKSYSLIEDFGMHLVVHRIVQECTINYSMMKKRKQAAIAKLIFNSCIIHWSSMDVLSEINNPFIMNVIHFTNNVISRLCVKTFLGEIEYIAEKVNHFRFKESEIYLRLVLANSQFNFSKPKIYFLRTLNALFSYNTIPTLTANLRLAEVLKNSGRYQEAIDIYNNVLSIQTQVLGHKHPSTLTTQHNLACVFESLGKYAEAEEIFIRVLQIKEKVLGHEHPSTLTTQHNLARVFKSIGKYAEAEEIYIRVLQIEEKVLGHEHLSTLTTQHNLAGVLESMEKYAEAEEIYIRILQIVKKLLGHEHPSTLTTQHNLAFVLERMGKYAKAEEIYIRVLQIEKKVLEHEHPSTLTTQHNLAGVLGSMERYAEAEEIYIRILQIVKKLLGHEHPSTLTTQHNLAFVLERMGKYAKAEEIYIRVLQIEKKVLKHEHPSTLTTQHNLAGVLESMEKYAEAEEIYICVLKIREKVLGHEHPDTLTTQHNLATVLQSMGKYAEAKEMYSRVLQIREKELGHEHPDSLRTQHNLAFVLESMEKYAEAEEIYICVLKIREKVLGHEHPSTLTTQYNLAGVLQSLGKYAEAKKIYIRVLKIREKVLGHKHPDSLMTQNNLATVLASIGKYAEAEEIFIRVLQIKEKVLGHEHPSTIMTQQNLASVLKSLEKYAEPEKTFMRVIQIKEEVLGHEHLPASTTA